MFPNPHKFIGAGKIIIEGISQVFFFFFFFFFYTSPHDRGEVLWFHVGHLCVCPCVENYVQSTLVCLIFETQGYFACKETQNYTSANSSSHCMPICPYFISR